MTSKTLKHDDVSITCFVNSRALKNGEKLERFKQTETKKKLEPESFKTPVDSPSRKRVAKAAPGDSPGRKRAVGKTA